MTYDTHPVESSRFSKISAISLVIVMAAVLFVSAALSQTEPSTITVNSKTGHITRIIDERDRTIFKENFSWSDSVTTPYSGRDHLISELVVSNDEGVKAVLRISSSSATPLSDLVRFYNDNIAKPGKTPSDSIPIEVSRFVKEKVSSTQAYKPLEFRVQTSDIRENAKVADAWISDSSAEEAWLSLGTSVEVSDGSTVVYDFKCQSNTVSVSNSHEVFKRISKINGASLVNIGGLQEFTQITETEVPCGLTMSSPDGSTYSI